ncbi:MAG: NAD(+)/NADH kinase [Elusimicrobia bacterium]|nr:NAD(+)/NADH kinase [Elusimicrobiota bacterium]
MNATKSHQQRHGVRSVVLFYNEQKPEAVKTFKPVLQMLRAKRIKVWMGHTAEGQRKLAVADIAIALGGDGTMLRVARVLAPHAVPLFGVNSGGLGFLSGTDQSELRRNLSLVLAGGFEMEERWMVSVEVFRGERRTFGPNIALNDCVIRCGDTARAITLRACSGELFLANYFGDGLIVSTPTGSTAYALAAGGPVVDPRLNAFLIAPICPHTLTQRPLIIPAEHPLAVKLAQRHAHEQSPEALMSLDGQVGCSLRLGEEVRIRRYEKPFRLLLNPKRSYFETLRRKMKWGER